MATLYLHVGHSKTGTSWLQAALRENAAALAGSGLAYPVLGGVGAEEGAEIGQGNGLALAASAGALEAGLRMIDRSACPAGAVLSSEEFFPRLSESADPAALPRAASAAGFGRVEMLLFIRDPVGHAASLWQQYLKRGGGAAPIEALFDAYSVPERVALFLGRFRPVEGVRVTCRNYSRHRRDLLAPMCGWLGLAADALAPPRAKVINRGMTRAELALQAAVNRRIGKAGRILSDALCAGLPDVPPDRIRPAAERYRPDVGPAAASADGGRLSFSPAQIDAIGAALGGEIRRLLKRAAARGRPFPFGKDG